METISVRDLVSSTIPFVGFSFNSLQEFSTEARRAYVNFIDNLLVDNHTLLKGVRESLAVNSLFLELFS